MMTEEQRAARAERCRRIAASGGRATVARHGTEHMAQIGKRGFSKALELGYGAALARKLGAGYEARFGRPLVLSAAAKEKNRIRAEARTLFPSGTCCVPGCDKPGQRHHINGVLAGNDPGNIAFYCDEHHRTVHQIIRRDYRRPA